MTEIGAGSSFSLAVTSTGELYGLGQNDYGQLGPATCCDADKLNSTPTIVTLPEASSPASLHAQAYQARRHIGPVSTMGYQYWEKVLVSPGAR